MGALQAILSLGGIILICVGAGYSLGRHWGDVLTFLDPVRHPYRGGGPPEDAPRRLRPFSVAAWCPCCHEADHARYSVVRWCGGRWYNLCPRGEHLHCKCLRCGAEWLSEVAEPRS